MRIYFVTDLHGSEVCFRKFLNSRKVFEPEVMVVGGDITGKVLVPVIVDGSERATAVTSHGETELRGEEEILGFERRVADTGSYAWRMTPAEYDRAAADPAVVDELFQRAVLDRVRGWMRLADERLEGTGVRAFVSGGNDDFWEVDDVLKTGGVVECPDARVVDLGEGVQMLSFGGANRTPWNCPRDMSEEDLGAVIDRLAGALDGGPAVFNLHVPPHDSRLDSAPLLDEDNRPRMGIAGTEMAPVGSVAVRERIERLRPILSLHGHVHESPAAMRLGDTLAINPGSEYGQGILRGAIVDVERGSVVRHQITSG